MRKDVIVKQEGYKECGASCLLSIIKYYGGNISIDKLLKLTNTNHLGTNFYNIKVAANEIGLNAKGYKVNDVKLLIDYEKPFICQTNNNNYLHFVVVYKIKDNKILVMDPAIGLINMDINSFNTIWTKNIMTFEKIKELIVDSLGIEEDQITMEASFKEDLKVDSLDLFEMVMSLEDEFGVEIPTEELEKMVTVGDVVNYIEEHK